ncbi:hypothetical protein AB1399_11475 [Hydrogenibacillus schlegelii]|uniref:Phage protein n=1 Tax=Hydrogenibacillus schlegelii TaxID=1484 RepID=A0A2T5G9M9_HYDSH|nr:hypothetical protein [Hydrogenibacillus schlegelii]PTQ52889.1 MAG: Phage protein [Hydrogenibacillus schlegelii]
MERERAEMREEGAQKREGRRFRLDREAIYAHPRVIFLRDLIPIDRYLDELEAAINAVFVARGETVVQKRRVVALRATDDDRLVSAFKAAMYLGNYHDMANRERFLKRMVRGEHSYEPIRGESILFLFIGVGKPVYDHLVTYSVGRTTRIAAGQRANLPWGYEVPVEAKHPERYIEMNLPRIREVVQWVTRSADNPDPEQLQAMRSSLPVGYIMPPFLLEFSEEALIKHVFRQRLFEKGAQGATVDVVSDMWEAVLAIDREKWETLYDYHGPHLPRWRRAMRRLRDEKTTLSALLEAAGVPVERLPDGRLAVPDRELYPLLMETVGKLPPTMWERQAAVGADRPSGKSRRPEERRRSEERGRPEGRSGSEAAGRPDGLR